ncbi:MAG: AhpC/TSA family protein [Prevotella sp.]|jgi:peroxiredoxin|nr:AhpC/TSA family protein [Prevotella sp.]
MKKIIIFICFISYSLLLLSQKNSEYIIHGTLADDSYDNTYVYLSKATLQKGNKSYYIDSVLISNKTFAFKGKANEELNLYHITISTNHCWVVIEPGIIDFNYKEENPTKYVWSIGGTPINDEINKSIIIPSQEITQKADTLQQLQAKGLFTPDNIKDISSRLASLSKSLYLNYSTFIKKNIDNSVGEYFLLTLGYLNDKDIAEIEPKLSSSTKEKFIKRTEEMKKSMNRLNDSLSLQMQPESTREGKRYTDFEGKMPDGSLIRLSELMKGKKLILIDFWASWCMPCLREMPSMSELNVIYKERGLEIIGISLDGDEGIWKKSIEKHKMTWHQLLSSQDETNNVTKIYGIDAIPHIILIDEHGKILSRGLRGRELYALIETLMK